MTRVLIISSMGPPPYVGGIENVVDTIVNSRLSTSYVISIFDTYRKPDPNRELYKKVIFAVFLFFGCAYRIIQARPQIVHIHFCSKIDFWKHSICLLVSKLLGRKTVFHLHGGSFDTIYHSYHPIKQFLVRLVFKLADIVVALSLYWQEFLSELTSPQKIQILPNPINCHELASFSQTCFTAPHSLVLLGSLGVRKGHYDVLKSLPAVLAKYPDTQMYFAGLDEDFGASEKLKDIVRNNNMTNNVNFIGTISGIAKLKLLGEASVVLLPSYGENMPISVLEGMAAKKPVIATCVGAIPEVFDHGNCGILIEPGDWEDLTQKIIYLFDNPEYAMKCGELAHQKTIENWDVNIIVSIIDKIYKNLLA